MSNQNIADSYFVNNYQTSDRLLPIELATARQQSSDSCIRKIINLITDFFTRLSRFCAPGANKIEINADSKIINKKLEYIDKWKEEFRVCRLNLMEKNENLDKSLRNISDAMRICAKRSSDAARKARFKESADNVLKIAKLIRRSTVIIIKYLNKSQKISSKNLDQYVIRFSHAAKENKIFIQELKNAFKEKWENLLKINFLRKYAGKQISEYDRALNQMENHVLKFKL